MGGGSGARTNKSASALLPHRRCPSWRRLGVDGIVCLSILQIGGFRVHGWCQQGGGSDPIRCASPSVLSPLLRRWLRRHGGAGKMYRPEYAQTVVCACDSWKMVYHVLVLWLEADRSGLLLRRRSRGEVSVLKFDGVSGDMLLRSDSFNGNGFAYGKLFWRSAKLHICDGTVSSSGEEVICLPSLWWSLR